jgi:outer membrane receptor for ferrienterochelin and colicins
MTRGFLWRSALAAALLASASARAQEDEELLGILNESVVTTASRSAESASTAPATSTSISGDELRRYGIRSVDEAINFLSLGVSTGGAGSLGSNSDLGARGVLLTGDSGNHFLYLVDGHALNEPFFGGARVDRMLGIPIEAIDRIEVIVGPGSVLYGSNAMLGVINIITKNAERLRGGHIVAETELPVSHRVAALAGIPFELFGERAEVTFYAQYLHQYGPHFELGPQHLPLDYASARPPRTRRGGPEDGIWGGTVNESSFARVPSGALRLKLGDLQLAVSGRIAEWGIPFGTVDFDDPDSFIRERSAAVDLRYRKLVSPHVEVAARAYADSYDYDEVANLSKVEACPYPDATTCTYERRIVSRWAGLELQSNFTWFDDGSVATLIGVDGRRRTVGSRQDSLDFYTRAPLRDSTGIVDDADTLLGAYLQQTWQPTSRLGFNAGARLDRDPRFSPVVSPRAAASLGVTEDTTLRAIYSEAFRAPSFQETDFKSLVRARGENLKPERVRSVEGSIEQRFGAHRVYFGAFRSWWKNLVRNRSLSYQAASEAVLRGVLDTAVPNVVYTQSQNTASIDSYGFNAALDGSFFTQRLVYGLNATEAFSRIRDAGADSGTLPVAPHFYGNARIGYDFGGNLPMLALAGFLLAARPADAQSSGFRPPPFAPTQVDLRLTASGKVPGVSGLTYRLSGDRVFGDRNPYLIGPAIAGTPEQPSAELAPVADYRATIGLEYSFFDE